jgi:hypothetical protein
MVVMMRKYRATATTHEVSIIEFEAENHEEATKGEYNFDWSYPDETLEDSFEVEIEEITD